jgi:hypothetical protein
MLKIAEAHNFYVASLGHVGQPIGLNSRRGSRSPRYGIQDSVAGTCMWRLAG